MAANYLPAITVALPHAQEPVKRVLAKSTAATEGAGEDKGKMVAGKTYPFHLALTNPLYDPIQVRLSVQRMHVSAPAPTPTVSSFSTTSPSTPTTPMPAPEKARRPPFAVSLPTTSFPIAAFAEAWEYEDDDEEDMFGVEDDELGLGGAGRGAGKTGDRDARGKPKTKTVGVLEKKANLTVVGGEVVIGKEARGNVKVCIILPPLLRINSLICCRASLICWYRILTARMTPRPLTTTTRLPRVPQKHKEGKSRRFRSILLLIWAALCLNNRAVLLMPIFNMLLTH